MSSAGQNFARQLEAVGGECDQTFAKKYSGKSVTDRPQLQAFIRHVRRGDHVAVTSMDRLGRWVIDLNSIVEHITGDPAEHTEQRPRNGASIEFIKERLTFEPGHAESMVAFQLNMMGAFAQFERELIRQRQAEGIAAAKNPGGYKCRRAG